MSIQPLIYTIRLEDGSLVEARPGDAAAAEALRRALRRGDKVGRAVRVRVAEGADTTGHALTDTVALSITLEGDVEGHTMTVRFPSIEDAKRFQQRLIIGGVLAASIAVGVAGAAQLSSQQAQVVPQAGPAITAPAVTRPAPLDSMKPGNIDARLRDSSTIVGTGGVAVPDAVSPGDIDAQLRDSAAISEVSGTSGALTPAKDAKDAKDAARLSGSDAGDEASNEGLGQRSVIPR